MSTPLTVNLETYLRTTIQRTALQHNARVEADRYRASAHRRDRSALASADRLSRLLNHSHHLTVK